MAQWERETIAERVFDNMLERSEMGLRNGAPAPYGYEYNDKRELVQVKEEAKNVKFIFDKYPTLGLQRIAKILIQQGSKTKRGELWSDYSVRYILKNPIYSGYIRWNHRSYSKRKLTGNDVIRKINQENFEPIITKETWDDIQLLIDKRSKNAFRTDNYYPFSGVARCNVCGGTMTGATKKRRSGSTYRYYKCAGRIKHGTCQAPALPETAMEKAFLNFVEFPTNVEIEHNEQQEIDKESLQKELNRINGRIERTKELYIDGDIPKDEYVKRLQSLHKEEEALNTVLSGIDEEVSHEEIQAFMQDLNRNWHKLEDGAKKAAISTLFNFIVFEVKEETKLGRYSTLPVLAVKDYEFN